MKDIFNDYNVEDNEELDDELNQLENEMMKDQMDDLPSAKGNYSNFTRLLDKAKPATVTVPQKQVSNKSQEAMLDDLMS